MPNPIDLILNRPGTQRVTSDPELVALFLQAARHGDPEACIRSNEILRDKPYRFHDPLTEPLCICTHHTPKVIYALFPLVSEWANHTYNLCRPSPLKALDKLDQGLLDV